MIGCFFRDHVALQMVWKEETMGSGKQIIKLLKRWEQGLKLWKPLKTHPIWRKTSECISFPCLPPAHVHPKSCHASKIFRPNVDT